MKKALYILLLLLTSCFEDNGLDVNCLCSEGAEYDEYCETICEEVI